jgi:hypothetical protein
MTEKLLHGPNVVAILQQMGGEAMAESMATGWLVHSGSSNCLFYRDL